MRTCSRCRERKPLGDFNRNRAGRDGIQNVCRDCQRLYNRQYYRNNLEKIQQWNREYWHKRTLDSFGISVEDYEQMVERQSGCCAICKQPCLRGRLSIDHAHDTGAVRGLLCRNCNVILGLANDDPAILEGAAAYLRQRTLKIVEDSA